jgi:hypothetical protein
MKKLFLPFIIFSRWVVGLPPRNPPGTIRTWFARFLAAAFIALIGWFLVLGPGVVLLPFAPRGFRSMADSTTTVYYQNDAAAARDVLRLAGEARDAILQFWGGRDEIGLFKGTRIYLGETPEAYYRLTMNRAGGSVMFRGVIVINLTKAGQVLSLQDYIRHELGHSFLRRRLGYIRKHLTVPAWFDEGCAVRVQGGSPDVDAFGDILKIRPRLLSLTSLRYHTDWEAMVFMEEGRLARQHYGYVGAFVEYVERCFGIEKIREYLNALSWAEHPDAVFARIYGKPLADLERQFLSEFRSMKGIQEEIDIGTPPRIPRVFIRWTLIFGALSLAVLWTIRQTLRASRFAFRKIRSFQRSTASP